MVFVSSLIKLIFRFIEFFKLVDFFSKILAYILQQCTSFVSMKLVLIPIVLYECEHLTSIDHYEINCNLKSVKLSYSRSLKHFYILSAKHVPRFRRKPSGYG